MSKSGGWRGSLPAILKSDPAAAVVLPFQPRRLRPGVKGKSMNAIDLAGVGCQLKELSADLPDLGFRGSVRTRVYALLKLLPKLADQSDDERQQTTLRAAVQALNSVARTWGADGRDIRYRLLILAGEGKKEQAELCAKLARLGERLSPLGERLAGSQGPEKAACLSGLPDDAMMNSRDLASRLDLPHEPLRKNLDRWRKENSDGWQETTEPRKGEPHYLYRVGAIRHLLAKRLASGDSSA